MSDTQNAHNPKPSNNYSGFSLHLCFIFPFPCMLEVIFFREFSVLLTEEVFLLRRVFVRGVQLKSGPLTKP